MRPLNIRVVSYNVLSSHLSEPTHYTTLNPEHLLPANRYSSLLKKLDTEVDNKSIICLQEVSQDWAGSLQAYFSNRSYEFSTGLYGRKFNGYMGVALAWPRDTMKLLDVNIARLSDTREEGWPKQPKEGTLEKLVSSTFSMFRPSLESWGVLSRPPLDIWSYAEGRFNILLSVKLEDKESGRSFAVGTYHMPCTYYAPKVMTIHVDLAARYMQKVAGDLPYVLAGDWNIKPSGTSYQLLTTGKIDTNDPEYPEPKWGMGWKPTAKPMRSAYAEFQSSEPDFTNYSRAREQEAFIDTLDYIFLSEEWKVKGVKALPKREEYGVPLPNLDKDEPSDHILIAADLGLED
eukprot:Nitzschia sp. Nitz4//scaffold8_size234185//196928//197965//NITZ4_001292-RA/size234185-processed-gene-0.131-mRNA-1//1//CDS//3329559911//6838//frame0